MVSGEVGWDEDEEEIRTNWILTSGRTRGTGSVFLLIVLDYTTVVKDGKVSNQWATSACILYCIDRIKDESCMSKWINVILDVATISV